MWLRNQTQAVTEDHFEGTRTSMVSGRHRRRTACEAILFGGSGKEDKETDVLEKYPRPTQKVARQVVKISSSELHGGKHPDLKSKADP